MTLTFEADLGPVFHSNLILLTLIRDNLRWKNRPLDRAKVNQRKYTTSKVT